MKKTLENYQADITWLESIANLPTQNFMLATSDRQIFLIRVQNFLNLLDNKLYPSCVNVLFGYSTKDKIILFLDFFITFSFFLHTVSI